MAHPQSNGQAERANAKVLRGLKARTFKKKMEACGRGWYDELQSVLWSIHTTATKSTGETPFFLVYGAEAVLPHEARMRGTFNISEGSTPEQGPVPVKKANAYEAAAFWKRPGACEEGQCL